MPATCLHEVETEVLARLADADRVFCCLDYDGTLAPLAPTPEQAVPLPGVADLLEKLAAAPGMQVAIVSGRPIVDVRRFLNIPALSYVGIHGLEIGLPHGGTQFAEGVAVVRSILPALHRRLHQSLGTRPGVFIEDKGAALACHYRLASGVDAVAARQVLSDMVRTYKRRGVPIMLVFGHEVAEIRPANINKGKTVCRLLASHGQSALPMYVGDDQTDEDAFKLLPGHAITVRVGPEDEPTAARYRVASPGDVEWLLRRTLDCRLGRFNVGAPP